MSLSHRQSVINYLLVAVQTDQLWSQIHTYTTPRGPPTPIKAIIRYSSSAEINCRIGLQDYNLKREVMVITGTLEIGSQRRSIETVPPNIRDPAAIRIVLSDLKIKESQRFAGAYTFLRLA